ncbi:MAG: N-6 DNA methylase [Planctomycetes bacterium]|nr:N-6 DNA methylase [Planctomycetota bacterium]
MELLFDRLGPEQRHPELADAVRRLAENNETERGAVFTRAEVVAAILHLTGYTPNRPLHRLRLLEPSFGNGDFLLPAIDHLLEAYTRAAGSPASARDDLKAALRGVELHKASFERTALKVRDRLTAWGLNAQDASALARQWLICDDFLLTHLEGSFDVIVGNPPYVRQERVPAALLSEYRRRYWTIYDRADLYVPFFERGLDLLAPGGMLGFICANRWTKNRYGGPLREKIARGFRLAFYIDLDGLDAFHSEVIAYPAITVIERPCPGESVRPTRMAQAAGMTAEDLPRLARAMTKPAVPPGSGVVEIAEVANGRNPWLVGNVEALPLLRELESRLPTLEDAGCKVGIGVATGADSVFIGDFDQLPVEESRKLPLVMAGDLKGGRIDWSGHGIINPFNPDGTLASLDDYPLFRAYIEAHRSAIRRRHVARKNPSGWYRTIDRIYPELTGTPKLLIPDIKGTATVVYDEGRYYPHHNLYYVTSATWNLRALQTVLRSSVSVMFVAAYCTRMAGGFLRFQAQYLRRIRVPQWEDVPKILRSRLVELAEEPNRATVDAAVFELYALSPNEADIVARLAERVQIVPKKERATT